MGVYIKGMEMPKDGEMLCVNIYPDGKVCINLDLDCKQIATAVPVPPHGRLIDADALSKNITGAIYHSELRAAPTIIPAEEEKS